MLFFCSETFFTAAASAVVMAICARWDGGVLAAASAAAAGRPHSLHIICRDDLPSTLFCERGTSPPTPPHRSPSPPHLLTGKDDKTVNIFASVLERSALAAPRRAAQFALLSVVVRVRCHPSFPSSPRSFHSVFLQSIPPSILSVNAMDRATGARNAPPFRSPPLSPRIFNATPVPPARRLAVSVTHSAS